MPFDITQALREGWTLSAVDNRYQIQKLDDPSAVDDIYLGFTEPKFESDSDALIHVALQAHAGSEYHREALSKVATLVTRSYTVGFYLFGQSLKCTVEADTHQQAACLVRNYLKTLQAFTVVEQTPGARAEHVTL